MARKRANDTEVQATETPVVEESKVEEVVESKTEEAVVETAKEEVAEEVAPAEEVKAEKMAKILNVGKTDLFVHHKSLPAGEMIEVTESQAEVLEKGFGAFIKVIK